MKSKPKRRGYTSGRTRAWKKAIVQVQPGQSIPIFQGLEADLLMPIRKPKPTSPGRRFVTYSDYAEITKKEPEKRLTEGLKKSGGRNAHGRKTARHRGGGAKRLYRKIDFKRTQGRDPRARSPRSSTTRTGPPTSRCSTTSTARSATSSPRTACASA